MSKKSKEDFADAIGELFENLSGASSRKDKIWEEIHEKEVKVGSYVKDEDGMDVSYVTGLTKHSSLEEGIVFGHGIGSRIVSVKEAKKLAKLLKKAVAELED